MLPPCSLLSWGKLKRRPGLCSIYRIILVHCDLGESRGGQKQMTLNSFSIYLDICIAQWEGDGEEGEAQSPGVTVTPEQQ